jgi:hypothetical protein
LTNLFFTTMVTAALSNNGRNQLTCIEKGKPKNNNKIRQHEKNNSIFQLPLFFFPVQLFFCSNNHHCNCHCHPSWQLPATHAASPLPPPSPLTRNEGTINNQSSSSSWQLKLLSAYAMLPPPTHRCCRCHHHAATAFPNALLLPLKLRFRKAAASAVKLAAATMLPPPPLPTRGNHRAITGYKIKKCNTID